MQAIKDNKVYTVDETSKKAYLSQGYNIVDDNGNVEHAPTDTVSYEKYAKLLEENKKLKAEITKLKKAENAK